MGNASSAVHARRMSTDTAATDTAAPKPNPHRFKEHKRHGTVLVKIYGPNSRNAEDGAVHVLTPRGALLCGSAFNCAAILKAMEEAGYPAPLPTELPLPDSRAHKLLVTYCRGWHLVPFPEVFSRHSGTCVVVGDRTAASLALPVQVGDCFRLGSVGVVVSELKLAGQPEQRLDARTLDFLRDEALAFERCDELAALATDEMADADGDGDGDGCGEGQTKAEGEGEGGDRSGLLRGERFVCYMCYEARNDPSDPLIAPCACRGDTRFLHASCLQKWYHSSAQGGGGAQAQVIRTTGSGAPACKICGTAYKTAFRRPGDGQRASILELETQGPFLSLVVVTRHDTNPGLFNTKFRLNFGPGEAASRVSIGRSSACALVLDYRTVSTVHAQIALQDGRFVLTDQRSSNGTLAYLRRPFALPFASPLRLRMGRTTLSLTARRGWTAALRALLMGGGSGSGLGSGLGSGGRQSVAVADLSLCEQRGGEGAELEGPSPSALLGLLAALPALPAEKSERDAAGGAAGGEDALALRSYTARTLADPLAEAEAEAEEGLAPGLLLRGLQGTAPFPFPSPSPLLAPSPFLTPAPGMEGPRSPFPLAPSLSPLPLPSSSSPTPSRPLAESEAAGCWEPQGPSQPGTPSLRLPSRAASSAAPSPLPLPLALPADPQRPPSARCEGEREREGEGEAEAEDPLGFLAPPAADAFRGVGSSKR